MKNRRIVIASVLKPADDTRMLDKMGMTLATSGSYEISIVGYGENPITAYPNINFYSIGNFGRISISRLLAPLKIFGITRKVQPDIVVVNTHELLIVAVLNRILFGSKIIYDIRENYYRNILYTEAFPGIIRPFLAAWVRLKEKLFVPFFHRIILAEKAYGMEMSFLPKHALIIENKSAMDTNRQRITIPGKIRLLFSGTLAESTGVFHAIAIARMLHSMNAAVELTIIGHCAKQDILEKIQQYIEGAPFIKLIGGMTLVPHKDIEEAIYTSDFGIVAYPPSRHTENSIPTKLYEYMAGKLPIILQDHPPWVALCSPYEACIPINLENPDAAVVLEKMNGPFYTLPPTEVTWEPEGRKLVTLLENIFV